MKFTRPDQLPATVTELDALIEDAKADITDYQTRAAGGEKFSPEDAAQFEKLLDDRDEIVAERGKVAAAEQSDTDHLNGLLDRAAAATAPGAPEAPGPDNAGGDAAEADAAAVVAEAEKATAEAADKQPVTAAAPKFVVTKNDIPADTPKGDAPKGWELLPSAPKFAEAGNKKIGFAEMAEAIASVMPGDSTGRNRTGTRVINGENLASQAIAKLTRPQGAVISSVQELNAELDRLASELPGHGKLTAEALVAAGGWCAPSEQLYDFCAVPDARDLLSLPEVAIKRGGVRFPAEPDYTSLLTGFHFTEPELQATDGGGKPTAVKNFVEVPCPDEMIEYRLEAIGWAVKAGILQNQAWPEAVQNFLEHFMVAHQKRVSALSISKMVADSTALTLPTDAILGATSGVLNGLHKKARDLQLRSRKDTIEGVAPSWFRDVVRADLALRDGLDVLSVTDAQIDGWLAARGIYLQYVADWQTNESGKPGDLTSHVWPGFVDVMLFPAGTFWRSLDNVLTLGVGYPLELVQLNQYSHGFVEDSLLVGKRCGDSLNVRVPLCVNGAVGARESINCSGPYGTTVTKTITTTGTPAGGTFTLKFGPLGIPSAPINYNGSAANVDTALTGIDDGVTAAGAIVTAGGALPTAITVTYPAVLGDLQVGTNSLSGGSSPTVVIS